MKQTQEHLRTLILTPRAYSSLQSSLSMLKQCSLCVMKDIPDIEFLIDQVLHTAFSRYANANDIANATDANEITLITRAVQEGFTFFTEKAVLMIRPR